MATSINNLSVVQQQALSAVASGQRVVNMLTPGGAARSSVGDILAAATNVVQFVNTANAALSNFRTFTNDPITTSFSTGQPYPGAFITSPTVTQLTPVNFSQLLSATTQTLSQLSAAQQAAITGRTGVILTTDADLATAMASMFNQLQSNSTLAFSVDLANTTSFVPITPQIVTTPTTISIPPLTMSPDMVALSNFVSSISASFPNTPGIEGVAASVWVGNLGVSVSDTGVPYAGVPSSISSGLYNDITTLAGTFAPSTTPITIVDYSFQQNQFNVLVAAAIDNGLSSTLSTLMATPLATTVTTQVIKNRLSSVALRGDASMLSVLFTTLGVNDIPNAHSLLAMLLGNLQPSDQVSGKSTPKVTASGIPLTTTTTSMTTAQMIVTIQAMLTQTGVTIQQICSQNTCNSVFCSQNLLNIPLIKSINTKVIEALLDTTTVQMALMF